MRLKTVFLISCLFISVLKAISMEENELNNYLNGAQTSKSFRLPIVYDPGYTISFFGFERFLHAFDGKKYEKIALGLGITDPDSYRFRLLSFQPKLLTKEDLLLVHTKEYLESFSNPKVISEIIMIPLFAICPVSFLKRKLLDPMMLATGGTVRSVELAQEYGWAINLSGGYHHAKAKSGEGSCFFADIPIAIHKAWKKDPHLKIMVIDLDAHQGNGVSAILGDDKRIAIFDMYNNDHSFPNDKKKQHITYNHPLTRNNQFGAISTHYYLKILKTELPKAIAEFNPDLIIYNAGTDILEKDPFGDMNVSRNGIIERDAFVFKMALSGKKMIPIVMLLSGGYTQESAGIVIDSIKNILSTQIKPLVSLGRLKLPCLNDFPLKG